MDLTVLSSFANIIIIGICLCVGYVIKHSFSFIPNKHIPMIMATLGLILSISTDIKHISLELILTGLFSGLASTGCYEAFKNLIKGDK